MTSTSAQESCDEACKQAEKAHRSDLLDRVHHAMGKAPRGADSKRCVLCTLAAKVMLEVEQRCCRKRTAAISSTGSITPWGKPGEEQTTSTVLRVIARLTAAGGRR